jgi:alkylhydroperoxidase/carboxymuconolactone decarboxylase family protein YurZ
MAAVADLQQHNPTLKVHTQTAHVGGLQSEEAWATLALLARQGRSSLLWTAG